MNTIRKTALIGLVVGLSLCLATAMPLARVFVRAAPQASTSFASSSILSSSRAGLGSSSLGGYNSYSYMAAAAAAGAAAATYEQPFPSLYSAEYHSLPMLERLARKSTPRELRQDENLSKLLNRQAFINFLRAEVANGNLDYRALLEKYERLQGGYSTMLMHDGLMPETILVKRAEDIRPMREVLDELSPETTLILERSESPEVGIGLLDTAPTSIKIAYSVPNSRSGLQKIHGGAEGAYWNAYAHGFLNHRMELNSLAIQTEAIDSAVAMIDLVKAGSKTCREYVREMISKQQAGELLILMGHVTGGRIRFADGTSITLNEARAGLGSTWVIGCETLNYMKEMPGLSIATGRPILYGEGVESLREVVRALRRHQSHRSLLHALRQIGVGVVAVPNCKQFETAV